MMEIPHEQFEYQKTLADIGVQIAKGRAELSELAQKKDAYLDKVQVEVDKRIEAVVKASEDALKQASSNQNLLSDWKKELDSFAVELAGWHEKLANQQQEFEVRGGSIMANLSQKSAALEKLSTEMKMQESKIKADREENNKRHIALNSKERQINDRYKTLLSAERELKK